MSAAVTGGSGVRPDKELTVFMTLKHTHNHGGGGEDPTQQPLARRGVSPVLCGTSPSGVNKPNGDYVLLLPMLLVRRAETQN